MVHQVSKVLFIFLFSTHLYSLAQQEDISYKELVHNPNIDILLKQKEPSKIINDFEKNIYLSRDELTKNQYRKALGVFLYKQGLKAVAIKTLQDLPEYYYTDQINLIFSDYFLFEKEEKDKAYYYFSRIDKENNLPKEESNLFELLRNRLLYFKVDQAIYQLEDHNVSEILVDNEDIWIGTWNGGILRYSFNTGDSIVIQPPKPSLESQAIRKIISYNNEIYIGQYTGLSVYNKRRSQLIPLSLDKQISQIQDIIIKNNVMYISTLENGIWTLTEGKYKMIHGGDYNYTVFQIYKNELYVGTVNKGLWIINDSQFDRPIKALNNQLNISSLSLWKGMLVIGTYGKGLYFYDGKKISNINKSNSLLGDDWILDIVPNKTELFVGTFGGGFSLIKDADHIKTFNVNNGFLSQDVAAISVLKDYIVLGTLGNGVYLVQYQKL